ncbi:MAG: DUF1398 domain-containing protein [Flavobacteriaceae bacterium]
MFTIAQIETAHTQVKSGADFPNYIRTLKKLGVKSFETWAVDSHTVYFGNQGFSVQSAPQYEPLPMASQTNLGLFKGYLKSHQNGETNYFSFCKHCAETGIEKWVVNLETMTCVYYDKSGSEMLIETIPG